MNNIKNNTAEYEDEGFWIEADPIFLNIQGKPPIYTGLAIYFGPAKLTDLANFTGRAA